MPACATALIPSVATTAVYNLIHFIEQRLLPSVIHGVGRFDHSCPEPPGTHKNGVSLWCNRTQNRPSRALNLRQRVPITILRSDGNSCLYYLLLLCTDTSEGLHHAVWAAMPDWASFPNTWSVFGNVEDCSPQNGGGTTTEDIYRRQRNSPLNLSTH